MAFVFKSEREDPSQVSNPNVGPGTYLGLVNKPVEQTNAPFLFNSQRKLDQKTSSTPGPGTYTNNIGFDVKPDTQKVDLFKSPSQGFMARSKKMVDKAPKNDVPGPGSYDLELSTLKKSKPKVHLKHSFGFLQMKSNPSIPSHESVFGYEEAGKGIMIKQPSPAEGYKGEKGDTIGPGQYDLPDNFSKNKINGINWNRYVSSRDFHMDNKNKTNGDFITPSDYNIFPIYKLKNSSVFGSKVPRMPNTKKKRKVYRKRGSFSAPRESGGVEQIELDEDDVPGPGFYHNPEATSDFTIQPYTGRNQYFGSTVARFVPQKDHTIGPGQYNAHSNFNVAKARNDKNKNEKSPVSTRERFKQMYKNDVPGPGQYNINKDEIAKKPWGRKGVFGTTTGLKKKTDNSKVQALPGPGSYKPEESIKKMSSNNSNIKKASSMFLSKTVREPNKVKKYEEPTPQLQGSSSQPTFSSMNNQLVQQKYIEHLNMEKYSMAENVRRKVEGGMGNPLLASLKSKMKIVAPFNSKSQRFKAKDIKEHEKFLGPGYYEYKTFVDSSNKKIKFASPSYNQGETKKDKEKASLPGPGMYYRGNDDDWNKRTYNINFAD